MPRTAFFDFIQSTIKGENVVMTASVDEKRDNIYVMIPLTGCCVYVRKVNMTKPIIYPLMENLEISQVW